ncbi:MAG: sugar transferase, partial [Burkholderiaceae bacterium]
MIKIFNHYIHRRTLLQILLDLLLVLGAVVASVVWRAADPLVAASVSVPSASVVAVLAVVLSGALGFYQRVHNRSVAQSWARAVLFVVLMVPAAYFILQVVALGVRDQELLMLTV